MRVLMFMRDALPPARVDVAVLFDSSLRALGIDTDFVGHQGFSGAQTTSACRGRQFDTGHRHDPRSLWREVRLLWKSARRYDVIVVRDKPLAAAVLRVIAAWRGVPLVYWMSFPMPLGDLMGARMHWIAGRRALGLLAWGRGTVAQWVQDHLVLPRAAHVFVQSRHMRDVVRKSASIPEARISAVPMGVDVRSLPPLSDQGADAATRVPVVAYLGSLDRARQLDVVIDAFRLVLRRYPTATLMLVGSAPREGDVQWLKAHASRLGLLDRVRFTGAKPIHEAWALVGQASVCVSPIPPGPLHDVSSPTKVVEYLALGVPVVANDIPDQRDLLEACGGGICVPFSAQAFADAIVALLDDLGPARDRSLQARPKVMALRSYDVLGAQVAATLRAVLG